MVVVSSNVLLNKICRATVMGQVLELCAAQYEGPCHVHVCVQDLISTNWPALLVFRLQVLPSFGSVWNRVDSGIHSFFVRWLCMMWTHYHKSHRQVFLRSYYVSIRLGAVLLFITIIIDTAEVVVVVWLSHWNTQIHSIRYGAVDLIVLIRNYSRVVSNLCRTVCSCPMWWRK